MSPDTINRYLREDQLTARLVWGVHALADPAVCAWLRHLRRYGAGQELLAQDRTGAAAIQRQCARTDQGGIGLDNCVYVNPEASQHWVIDYRIYDPDRNGKSRLDHVQDMLTHIVQHKQLLFHAVLMDTWYATRDLMLFIDFLHRVYYCPLKDNRQVGDPAAKNRIAASMNWRGAGTSGRMARSSRSRVSPETTK